MRSRAVRLIARAQYAKGWEEARKKGAPAIRRFMESHATMRDYVDEKGPVYIKDGNDSTGLKFQFRITDESVDRMNDVIKMSGWDWKNYRKNPVVPFAHNTNQLPVAQSVKLWKDEGFIKSVAKFTPKDLYPFGHTVGLMIKGGFLRATSVGFRPLEIKAAEDQETRPYGLDFNKQELLEYSIVPVPANANALIEAGTKGISLAEMKEFVGTVLDSDNFDPERDGLVVECYERAWKRYSGNPIIVEMRGTDLVWPRKATDKELGLDKDDTSGDAAACPNGEDCPKGESDEACPKGDKCPKYNGQETGIDLDIAVLREFIDLAEQMAEDGGGLDTTAAIEALDSIEASLAQLGEAEDRDETLGGVAFAVDDEGRVIINYNGIEINKTYDEDVRFVVTVGSDGLIGLAVGKPERSDDWDPDMDDESEELDEDTAKKFKLLFSNADDEETEDEDDETPGREIVLSRRELRELATNVASVIRRERAKRKLTRPIKTSGGRDSAARTRRNNRNKR